MRALVSHHIPVLAGGKQFHRFGAEDRAQRSVEVRGAAAPLQVTQHASAGLLAGAFLDFRGNHPGDAAQSSFAVGGLVCRRDERATRLAGAFGHDDQGEVLARFLTLLNLGADAVVGERDLRDQDNIRTASDSGIAGKDRVRGRGVDRPAFAWPIYSSVTPELSPIPYRGCNIRGGLPPKGDPIRCDWEQGPAAGAGRACGVACATGPAQHPLPDWRAPCNR